MVHVALLAAVLAASPGTVLFLSDFGVKDDSVAVCKGEMLRVDPGLRIVDISHDVKPYSILDGARFLAGTAPHYPAGTVFVAVVDPGVGSTRKAMVAKSKRGQFFVLPDNGLITLVAQQDGLEAAREITNVAWMAPGGRSSTFHGRDIFSPVGAHVARGDVWTKAGPPLPSPVLLELPVAVSDVGSLTGTVLAIEEPYGNLVTNIPGSMMDALKPRAGEVFRLSVGNTVMEAPLVHTFSDVKVGEVLLYVDSRGRLSAALNQGNLAAKVGAAVPYVFKVERIPAR